jgi:hypothetical protein
MNPLAKYKIGLGAIGALCLVLLVIMISQSQGVKQDKATYDAATKAADTLNSYTLNKGVPASLDAAGINAPPEITYQKISASEYRFCVNYKTASSSFNATSIETELLTGGAYDGSYDSGAGDSTYLYLTSDHKKGNNCQTIKDDYYTSGDNYTGAYAQDCNVDASGKTVSDDVYYACLDKQNSAHGN